MGRLSELADDLSARGELSYIFYQMLLRGD